MPASQYRDPIVIQSLVPAANPNALGEKPVEDDDNWQTYFACFGEVVTKGTREFTRAGIVDADISHLIRVPWSKETLAVTSDMRIQLQATGEVLHVEDAYRRDPSNRQIEIMCRN